MFSLFHATSKVQKDRQIMRDTDSRIAKYSRRGLLLNFLVVLLCLVYGDFFQREQQLAIFLVTGLLFVTLLRSYYLFRFDQLYAKGPARWRNQYFFVSICGAIWWSVILVSLTAKIGMQEETLVMWLYSVVFYSSVANVFSPYNRFLFFYLLCGQIPAAVTALLLGTSEGYMYAVIMAMFFLMLTHQAKISGEAYWDRLEANYFLRERAKGLEDEKRDSIAAIELKNEFLSSIGNEFRTSLNDVLGTLSLLENSQLNKSQTELVSVASNASERQLDLINNVVDFSRITSHQIVLESNIFNLRKQLNQTVKDLMFEAHQQGVELYYIFEADMPARVRGDSARLNQILTNLLSHAVKHSEHGEVSVDVKFKQDSATEGELQVLISDERHRDTIPERVTDSLQTDSTSSDNKGLAITICKGLAECMNGSVHVTSQVGMGHQYFCNVKLQVAGKQVQPFNSSSRLKDNKVMLCGFPDHLLKAQEDDLKGWGMLTASAHDLVGAAKQLEAGDPDEYQAVILYNKLGESLFVDLRQRLENVGRGHIKMIVIISELRLPTDEVEYFKKSHTKQVKFIKKPLQRQRLHDALVELLLGLEEADDGDKQAIPYAASGKKVLIAEDHRVNQMVAMGMLKKMGYEAKLACNGKEAVDILAKESFDLVLMDCQMPEMDGYIASSEIRRQELESGNDEHIPIVAMTAHTANDDQAKCFAAGMDDHLPKPVRFKELESRLRRWLGSENQHDD